MNNKNLYDQNKQNELSQEDTDNNSDIANKPFNNTYLISKKNDLNITKKYISNEENENIQDDNFTECESLNKLMDIFFDDKNEDSFDFINLYDRYDDLLRNANLFYAKNDLNACIAILRKTIKLFPTKNEPYYVLGLVFEEQKNYEKAYLCFTNCAHLKKSVEMFFKLYEIAKILDKKIDLVEIISKIQKIENSKNLAEEKVFLYNEIFRNTNEKIYYYKMIFATFELIPFNGFIYNIRDYTEKINLYGIKKLICIVYNYIKIFECKDEYKQDFIEICFQYKEYEIFKELLQNIIKDLPNNMKIKYVIAKENISNENKSENTVLEKAGESKQELINKNIFEEFKNKITIEDYEEEELLNENDFLLDKILDKDFDILQLLQIENFEFDELIFDLLDVLLQNKKLCECKKLLEKVLILFNLLNIEDICSIKFDQNNFSKELYDNNIKYKLLFYTGLYFYYNKNSFKAIEIFTFLNNVDIENEEVKHILYTIYMENNNQKMAETFENEFENIKKRKITPEEISSMRERYKYVIEILHKANENQNGYYVEEFSNQNISSKQNDNIKSEIYNFEYKTNEKNTNITEIDNILVIRKFVRESNLLLRDFFSNSVLFNPEDYQGKEMNKLEQLEDKNSSRKEARRLNYIYKNFHGLMFEEWFYLIKTNILCLLDLNEYQKGMEIIHKFLSGYFREKVMKKYMKYFKAIGFLGMRFSVLFGDLVSFLKITKRLFLKPQNLLNYFVNYFPNYVDTLMFKQAQRNLYRIILRSNFKDYKSYDDETYIEENEDYNLSTSKNDSFDKNISKYEKEDYNLSKSKNDFFNNHKSMNEAEDSNSFASKNDFLNKDKSEDEKEDYNLSNSKNDFFNNNKFNNEKEDYNLSKSKNDFFNNNKSMNEAEDSNLSTFENNYFDDKDENFSEENEDFDSFSNLQNLKENEDYNYSVTKNDSFNHAKNEERKINYQNSCDDIKTEFLCTLFPRHLHKNSVKLVDNLIGDKMDFKESILVSIIFFNHSTTHKNQNLRYYLEKGFEILFNLEKRLSEEKDEYKLNYVWYTIGRAYSMFGLNGIAELYYKKCVNCDDDIKNAVFYNLSIIYKNNKNLEAYKKMKKDFQTDF